MANPIVHHKGLYFEWSTVSDAPASCAMTRSEFEAWYKNNYGERDLQGLPRRLDRADQHGCSYHDVITAEECVSINTCGNGGISAPFEEVIGLVIARRSRHRLPVLIRCEGNYEAAPITVTENWTFEYQTQGGYDCMTDSVDISNNGKFVFCLDMHDFGQKNCQEAELTAKAEAVTLAARIVKGLNGRAP